METDSREPSLPYTASHTGRKARVGYLGFEGVGFEELWPLFAGLILSVALGIRLFLGAQADAGHWVARTLIAALPFLCGYGYLRVLVQGRPPHFKSDMLSTALRVRLDFANPPVRAFPLVPRLAVSAHDAAGPARAANQRHPMHALGRVR
jgi:hypothetical protein